MAVRVNSFGAWDYVVFVAMLLVSMVIGVYFAVKDRNQNSQGEYLLAGRSMSTIPVAISILVSFMSAILILGNPAEMYTQGTILFMGVFGLTLGILIAAFFFVPLIYPLKITSAFEYLELRFKSKAVRLTGTLLMVLYQIIYLGLATFAPATALEAVTGFPVWATIIIIGVVATFYTSIGGMKAVVWSDVFQSLVMVAGMLAIVIQGCVKVGGLAKVWEINQDWERIEFSEINPDPRVRHTVWGLLFGYSFIWLGIYGVTQASVQRYCSLPTLRKAQASVLMNIVGIVFLQTIACLSGVVAFAYYVTKNCDPLGRSLIDNPNQIIPFFVMETLSYPAIPGIFISCLFSGALSSVSSSLNALAAVTWEDILKPRLDDKISEARKTFLTKLLVLSYGVLAVGMSFIAQNLEGSVLQAAVSLLGAVSAPLTGLFIQGALLPWTNAKGAMTGAVCSLAVSLWLSIGTYVADIPKDRFPFPNGTCSAYLPNETMSAILTSASPTPMTSTIMANTAAAPPSDEISGVDHVYTVSYMWYSPIGVSVSCLTGLVASFVTGANSMNDVPLKYQIPIFSRIFCCLPRSWKRVLQCNRDFPDPEDLCADEKDLPVETSPQSYYDIQGKQFDNKGFHMGEKISKQTAEQRNGFGPSGGDVQFETKDDHNIQIQRL